ncbi:MAG: S8 family serine peptidase [Planctomycetota bacterium]|jgi:subtilisin family serine protease
MSYSQKQSAATRLVVFVLGGVLAGHNTLLAGDLRDGSSGAGLAYTQAEAGEPHELGSVKIHPQMMRLLSDTAGDERIKAWVLFKDKGITSARAYDAALAEVAATYSPRATERRRVRRTRPGLFDWDDIPVSQAYVDAVRATGAQVHVTSRWVNGASAWATRGQIEDIAGLSFVATIQPVRRGQRGEPNHVESTAQVETKSSRPQSASSSRTLDYGESEQQLSQINLIALHDLGHTGAGVIIGILDSGFERSHVAFNDPAKSVNIVAEWDFVNDDPYTGREPGDMSTQHAHGTRILGVIGAYRPGEMIGGAFDASFILCKTEDDTGEYRGEEDNYVAGLEFIEANGGDVATSSLGYVIWYDEDDYDGRSTITAVATNTATANGMHCSKSAGNGGNDGSPLTRHLDSPADAFQVIACGNVDSMGTIDPSSSDGPTVDWRVKPEVLARGVNTRSVNPFGDEGYVGASGTSLSTPLIASALACLTQAHPEWTVDQMRSYLFRSGDYYSTYHTYDSLFVRGYGVIDAAAALIEDCNENGTHDATDIATETSDDCNNNGLPDECDLDAAGDYNDVDCNGNGALDMCDIAAGISEDCDYNRVPDECQPDCDEDSVPDVCMCAPIGSSPDSNDNRVPDECELVPVAEPAAPHDAAKNRYVSFDPNNNGVWVAFSVEMTAGLGPTGMLGWVGEVDANNVARVVPDPFFTTEWPPVVHLGDCEVVPTATYELRTTLDAVTFSDPHEVGTISRPGTRYYGDVVGTGTGNLPPLPGFTPPNGAVNVSDIQAFLLTVQGPSSPSVDVTWVDLHGLGDGVPPNFMLNVADLQRILWGIAGQEYPDAPEHMVPADCP